jgi:hypothetical protein
MTSLYDCLVELQDVTHVLIDDVEQLRTLLGERHPALQNSNEEEANRRFYVRAIFAFIEAVAEQHKRLLLALDEQGTVALAAGVREALSGTAIYVQGQRNCHGKRAIPSTPKEDTCDLADCRRRFRGKSPRLIW